ncbi:MAG: OmpH family outer membrane protein [Cyanobacteria bacterium]|nr:OmpH family outer membrane protein [Cyanobacteriota bacterium]
MNGFSRLNSSLKKGIFALSALTVVSVTSVAAYADSIGIVDIDKVIGGYNKAQTVMADIKVKEAELRKMQAEFVKQMEESKKNNPKNPVANEQLEKDLNNKLNARLTEYRDWTANKQKEIDTDLETTIKDIAKGKNIDVVLSKQAVFQGGTDITNDILVKLNSAGSKSTSSK